METHEVRWHDALDWIRRGEIIDGKSLVALTFVQCLRTSDPKAGG
jgi:hypothetical protein